MTADDKVLSLMDDQRRDVMKAPDDVSAMLRLRALGWGSKRIAAELGCARNTVRRWLTEGDWCACASPSRSRKLDGLSDWIAERFRRHTGNADVVRQELAAEKGLVVSLRTVERATAPLRRELSRLRQLDQRIGVRFAIAIDSQRCGMSGKSPVLANEDQRAVLTALAGSRDRGEADRARAILLTLSGWTSPRIAEAFSVREDTVRLWRSDFSRGGTDALKASVAPGPSPVKSETALRVVAPLLEEPVANRPNWTIARMRAEIELREGVRISRSQLSKALRKKSSVTGGRGTP
jgi:transposase